MDPSPPPVSLGCRLVAEFEDDAGDFAKGEPEFVAVPGAPAGPASTAAGDAKKFWVKVTRRFTEPVPGRKGRLRVRGAEDPDRGTIVVEHGRPFADRPFGAFERRLSSGEEVDVTDRFCLTVLATGRAEAHDGDSDASERVKVSFTPIPWTEVVHMRFEVERLARAEPTPRGAAKP